MKHATHSERERFVMLMARNFPTATASICQRLLRFGSTYGRLVRDEDVKPDVLASFREHIEEIVSRLGGEAWFPTPTETSYAAAIVSTDGLIIISIPTS